MPRTANEIQAEIDTIRSALSDLYRGERLTQLVVGTGDSQRRYTYQEITVESLKGYLNELQAELQTVTSSGEMTFRVGGSIPLIINKYGVR